MTDLFECRSQRNFKRFAKLGAWDESKHSRDVEGQFTSAKRIMKEFDPNQPRDERGRWTATGALAVGALTGAATIAALGGPARAASLAQRQIRRLGTRTSLAGGGLFASAVQRSLYPKATALSPTVAGQFKPGMALHRDATRQFNAQLGTIGRELRRGGVSGYRSGLSRQRATIVGDRRLSEMIERERARSHRPLIIANRPSATRQRMASQLKDWNLR